MKTSTLTGALGVLALLGSSVASAATLTMVASTTSPNVSDVFTVTLSATSVSNIGGITIAVNWDSTKASLDSSVLPLTGPVAQGTGSFLIVNGSGNSRVMDVLPGSPPINGDFDIAVLTFTALAPGAVSLVVNDDGGIATGWFDNDTADNVAVSYVQTNIQVVPAPAAVWLLGTGIAGLVVRKARRIRAAA
jgi:hypothetical protein